MHVSGAEIVLTWNSAPGETYLVQRSSDLQTWTTIGLPISGGEYREPITSQPPAKFFRVLTN
jgi:hypothetical protein